MATQATGTMNVLEIKATVRSRDGYRCVDCGMTNDEHLSIYGRALEVHRKEPGSAYSVDGCETVCKGCHGLKPRQPHGAIYESAKTSEHCVYATARVDDDILRRARAFAQLHGISLQDWLSDLINVNASKGLNMDPIKRKPNRPHPKRPK